MGVGNSKLVEALWCRVLREPLSCGRCRECSGAWTVCGEFKCTGCCGGVWHVYRCIALEHALSVASSRVQFAVVECGSTGALGKTGHVRTALRRVHSSGLVLTTVSCSCIIWACGVVLLGNVRLVLFYPLWSAVACWHRRRTTVSRLQMSTAVLCAHAHRSACDIC
jgi:hypothetical protein